MWVAEVSVVWKHNCPGGCEQLFPVGSLPTHRLSVYIIELVGFFPKLPKLVFGDHLPAAKPRFYYIALGSSIRSEAKAYLKLGRV